MENAKQWTHDEELKMLKLIRNKISIEEIAKKHDRDIHSIELRLQKIIYENISINNNDAKTVSLTLNLPYEDVIHKYQSYKSAIESNKELNRELNRELNKEINEERDQELDLKIKKLERENKLIRLILENKVLHKKLNEQIKKNNINKNILDIIKNMRK